ncbi:T9SS type A sorting domain-containing protein [Spirosoma sp. BT704]|uniref:T9SS type A sorting domain-containing protein n=2 Tax=Spirosoma validum TaxID=2771355 RepID=A0A927GE25_9BACT|nr:T9SS type A sorting domain-containing protein [Spirosoma validum]
MLKFWVRSTGSNPISVYTTNADSGGDTPGYVFTTPTNQWQEMTVTMSQLGNPAQIKRLNFQNYSSNNVTVYFDNIRLESVSGAREAVETSEGIAELLVFPNPSVGLVTVRYVAQRTEPIQIRVVNVNGTILQHQDEQAKPGENAFQLDMRERSVGAYLIQLQGTEGTHVRKMLIQR